LTELKLFSSTETRIVWIFKVTFHSSSVDSTAMSRDLWHEKRHQVSVRWDGEAPWS